MDMEMDKAGFKDGEEFILIPVRDHKWTDDFSYLREMTCINHPTAVYYTKNPFERNIHIIKFAVGYHYEECECPFGDLRVKLRTKQSENE